MYYIYQVSFPHVDSIEADNTELMRTLHNHKKTRFLSLGY